MTTYETPRFTIWYTDKERGDTEHIFGPAAMRITRHQAEFLAKDLLMTFGELTGYSDRFRVWIEEE